MVIVIPLLFFSFTVLTQTLIEYRLGERNREREREREREIEREKERERGREKDVIAIFCWTAR